jgi:hypothetical protein
MVEEKTSVMRKSPKLKKNEDDMVRGEERDHGCVFVVSIVLRIFGKHRFGLAQ